MLRVVVNTYNTGLMIASFNCSTSETSDCFLMLLYATEKSETLSFSPTQKERQKRLFYD